MEKTNTTTAPRPATRRQLVIERDQLVREIRFRPANGLTAREGTGLGGRFLSAAEVADRSASIERLNVAIKAAEEEAKAAREQRLAEAAHYAAQARARAHWQHSPEGQRHAADIALNARKGQQRAAKVVAAYRATIPAMGVRDDRRARKAAVNGWDMLVGNYATK